jgi:UDP-N-acetyl-D-galactosamine dehydrogenase
MYESHFGFTGSPFRLNPDPAFSFGSRGHSNALAYLKEDCPDLRNSKVIDVIHELHSYGLAGHVHDPVAAPAEARHEYGVDLVDWDDLPRAGAIVAAMSHRARVERPVDQLLDKLVEGGVYADVKSTADAKALQARGAKVWRL